MNKVLPVITGSPATSPLQQSAVKDKNSSAAAESDFIIAGKQAEFAHSTQAKEHKLCCAEHVKEMLQAKAESPQIGIDLQERKFKNRDPIPTRPLSMKFAMIKSDLQRSKFKNHDPIPTRP